MMMQRFITLLMIVLLFSCSKDNPNNNCNYLVDAGVDFTVNLNLPQFSGLEFPSNVVYVPNQGNGGVFVINIGSGLRAWDAADPNHVFSNCSIMSRNGINVTCNCEDANEYELYSGQPVGETDVVCGLKEYRVEATGQADVFLVTD